MSTTARLAAFVAALSALFGGAALAGAAIGPAPEDSPEQMTTENHETETAAFAEVAREIVGAENVLTEPAPVMGSEDFADMLHMVPGSYCWVGHAGTVPLHNPAFVLDDGILPVGASLLARIVEKRLQA